MLRRFLREYLSFTSGERNGFLVLVILLWAAILLRIFLPVFIRPVPPDTGMPATETGPPAGAARDSIHYYPFDPNTAGYDELVSLGIPGRTVQILINYRNKGGRFDRKEDLLKIYGMTREDYTLLEPFIAIETGRPDPVRNRVPGLPAPAGNPGPVRPGRAERAVPVTERFDLNLADTTALKSVRGIGPVFAGRIVKYRELLGGFYSAHQLREVYGLSDAQFDELTRCTYADPGGLRPMDLNRVEKSVLSMHPYLDPYQAASLISYRNTMGAFRDLSEISENHLLPPDVFIRILPYLEISR